VDSVDSGAVKNEKVTQYKVKDKDGNIHTEKVVFDKDKEKVVKRTMNGKEVKDEAPKSIQYHPGNGEYFLIGKIENLNNTMQKILKQLVEMNYYICKAYGDDDDRERVEKALSDG